MVAAVRVHKHGGPEVLTFEDIEIPPPGAGQVRLRQHAAGINYIDTYFRTGAYPSPVGMPFVAGNEGSGEVIAVGDGVTDLKVGDRVGYVVGLGAYAAERNLPAERAVKLPDVISYETAAATMLKGMTVCYLLRRTFVVKPGDTVLIHAAAGGVGLIASQWANALGATVIGTVGSKDKAELAKAAGCHHTILYREEDFVARVKEITKGKGVPVVYDSVGKDTFDKSLECLAPLGLLVLFGQSSGPVPPFNLANLVKGSYYITRPTMGTYQAHRDDLLASARALFNVVKSGKVKIRINHTYPLAEAAQAHADVAARKTTGSVVLMP
jgi:NADPH:quinone reductase